MRVILSLGHGRLHLIQSAQWIAHSGVNVMLVCGWVPQSANSIWVRAASLIAGRDLSSGMRKRIVSDRVFGLRSCAIAEAIDQILRVCCRLLRISTTRVSAFGWRIFGWQSRKYLKNADVFHCRSGAGQGGAIRRAKRSGMKVLVDHSALWPYQTELNLCDDYARWHEKMPIAPHVGVWIPVEQDCREADMILVNAEQIKDSFVRFGFDPSKIRVAYLGVRPDFFALKLNYRVPGTLRILYTGSFYLLKGCEYFIRAFEQLKARGVAVKGTVIGTPNMPAELWTRSSVLPIKFTGHIPQDELKGHLANSDIYLFPSLADGCASSGMEAMAAGLCVVATKESGLPIVDGETGCIVPMKDPEAIVEKIIWLKEHPAEIERIGRNAAKLISSEYTWEKYAERVKCVYEELVG